MKPASSLPAISAHALDALPDAAMVLDAAGKVTFVNAGFCAMFSVDADALLFRPFADLAETTVTELAPLIAKVHEGRKAELLLPLAAGRQALVSVRRYGSDPVTTLGLVVVLRDLSVLDHERQRAAAHGSSTAFKFLSAHAVRADLARQRRVSKPLDSLLTLAERAMRQNARLLLHGESGVGKTEIARYLHEYVSGETAPFVHVNCGAIPESLFESEMFGYEKGSFTGALQSGKKGLIESADGGTLFLDEIGEVPLIMQAKMLKFLEAGAIQRIGAAGEKALRVRVISATNRDLPAMVSAGQFRRDLYYRLAVVPLHVRPLRESRELIAELTEHFVTLVNQRRERALLLGPQCMERLQSYAYPGNIRELQNIVQQVSVMCDGEAGLSDLPENVLRDGIETPAPVDDAIDPCADLRTQLGAFEQRVIHAAIARHGSKRKAAEALGVDIGTIVRKTQRNKQTP